MDKFNTELLALATPVKKKRLICISNVEQEQTYLKVIYFEVNNKKL
jgi:hypothetical protein